MGGFNAALLSRLVFILPETEPVDSAAWQVEEGSAASLVRCTIRVIVAAVQPGTSLLRSLNAALGKVGSATRHCHLASRAAPLALGTVRVVEASWRQLSFLGRSSVVVHIDGQDCHLAFASADSRPGSHVAGLSGRAERFGGADGTILASRERCCMGEASQPNGVRKDGRVLHGDRELLVFFKDSE